MPESTQNVRFLATRPGRALHLIGVFAHSGVCGYLPSESSRASFVGPADAQWAKYSAGGLCTKCATALDQLRLAARVAVRAETTARRASGEFTVQKWGPGK